MSEDLFLSGRVIRRSLPEFTGSPPTDAPRLRRLHLDRGDLAQIHDSDEGMRYIAWLELRSGRIRGNHYHTRKHEILYLATGGLELVVGDIVTGERAVVRLRVGDWVSIEPGVAHAVRVLEPGQAIEFSPQPFDPSDIVRFLVAEQDEGRGE